MWACSKLVGQDDAHLVKEVCMKTPQPMLNQTSLHKRENSCHPSKSEWNYIKETNSWDRQSTAHIDKPTSSQLGFQTPDKHDGLVDGQESKIPSWASAVLSNSARLYWILVITGEAMLVKRCSRKTRKNVLPSILPYIICEIKLCCKTANLSKPTARRQKVYKPEN